jgi:putative ABC transport system permease protein
MNLIILVWSYLKARPLNTFLNIVLLSLGIAIITLLLLVSRQMREKMSENSRGIDLVIGAKGSPLQLILCNVFHIDFPTGNISLREAEKIAKNRLVKKAIPLALGDSFESFRIVGTDKSFTDLYNASIQSGDFWKKDFEVTLGSNAASTLRLTLNDTFTSTHGMTKDGHGHDEQRFVVKGILAKSNSVIDNLILTNIESIWKIHDMHSQDSSFVVPSGARMSSLVPTAAANDSTKEITSLLIQYRSPMGAIQMPRWVNSQSSLQAASPAFETARLFSILGIGVDILKALSGVLVFISALSIFIALYNSLKERKYDMAIMRSMGASRQTLVVSILLEGSMLTVVGTVTGLLVGHGVMLALASAIDETQKAGINGFVFYPEEWIILVASLLLGVLCAIIPAVQAYRTDISKVLAGNS